MDKAAGILQDNEGNNSSMRLAFLATLLVVLVTWCGACYVAKGLVELPPTMLGLVMAMMGGKVFQKQQEMGKI